MGGCELEAMAQNYFDDLPNKDGEVSDVPLRVLKYQRGAVKMERF